MNSDKFEQLSPDNLTEKLKSRQEDLSVLLAKKLRAIKNAPEGNLRIAQAHKGKKIQYFHIIKSGDTKGTYISHNQHLLAKRLAQKQYDQSLIKVLHWQIAALTKFITKSEKQIENLYDKLCSSRRELITPATLPDEQYIAAWKSVQWEGHSFSPDQQDAGQAEEKRDDVHRAVGFKSSRRAEAEEAFIVVGVVAAHLSSASSVW